MSEQYDSRLIKEYYALSAIGDVMAFTWSREHPSKTKDEVSFAEFSLRIPHSSIIIVFVLPLFWIWLLVKLFKYSPNYVHSTDLHTMFAAVFYRFLRPNTRIIYDMYDIISLFWRDNKAMFAIIRRLETIMVSISDAVIAPSPQRLALFKSECVKLASIVPNFPILVKIKAQRSTFKNRLLVRYAGGIGDEFLTNLLLKACKKSRRIKLELAGRIVGNVEKIRREIKDCNAFYIGVLPYKKALRFVSKADVVPVLYNKRLSYMAAPSKLFEALMLGVPVISNVCAEVVLSKRCGIYIEEPTAASLFEALNYLLKNPSVGVEMGLNGLIAVKNSYNWAIASEGLIALYQKLIRGKVCINLRLPY